MTGSRPETPGVQIDLINIGNTRDLNRIPNEVVEYYISLGDNQIDGILSQMYYTPLRKCANGQWDLDASLNEYNQIVEISDASNLVAGDEILIRDDATGVEESHIVNEVLDQYRFTVVDAIETVFEGDEVRVLRIQYPPPVNQISARYASSFIYDKYFAAQNAPNVSDYGKEMRSVAMGQLNDILNGRVILKCQRRRGDHWGNPWNEANYSLREGPQGFDTGSRDMSKPG